MEYIKKRIKSNPQLILFLKNRKTTKIKLINLFKLKIKMIHFIFSYFFYNICMDGLIQFLILTQAFKLNLFYKK